MHTKRKVNKRKHFSKSDLDRLAELTVDRIAKANKLDWQARASLEEAYKTGYDDGRGSDF